MILLGAGPFVGLACTAGLVAVTGKVWRDRLSVDNLLLVGAVSYFASIGLLEIKWVRYLLPLVPYLCLFATAFAFSILRTEDWGLRTEWTGLTQHSALSPQSSYSLAARQQRGQFQRWAVFALLLVSSLLGAIAVNTIFRSEHTQVKASNWILNNIPPGSRIGIEKTALEMPLPLPGTEGKRNGYEFVKMDPLLDMTSRQVADTLHAQVNQSDYLIIDATQAAGTVPHLPWRYPVQIRYYDLLLRGQLGFSVALHSTSYPRIGSLEIPDDGGWVDLSFMDSSHPPIWILKKERALTDADWAALFAEAIMQPSVATRQRP